MKTVLLCSLVASAAAFAPAATSGRVSTSLNEFARGYPGAINFRGQEMEFDPLKLSETYEPLLPWFRESELKHGRTAMLAVVGFIVQDLVRIPGDMYSFEAIPAGSNAHDILMDKGPMGQLLFWIGLWDLIVTGPAASAAMKGEREPGYYAWNIMAPKDDAAYKKKVDSELLNGRLAMIAVGGIATQNIVTGGHPFPYI